MILAKQMQTPYICVILFVELLWEVRKKVIVLLTKKLSHHSLIMFTVLKSTPRVPCDCAPNFPVKVYFCYNRHQPFLSDRFLQKLSCLNDFQIRVLQYFLLGAHCFPVSADTTRKATSISQKYRETQSLLVLIWIGDLKFKIWIGRNVFFCDPAFIVEPGWSCLNFSVN